MAVYGKNKAERNINKQGNTMNDECTEHRGYIIGPDSKTVWKRNKDSGHEWPEQVPKSGFTVKGVGIPCTQNFRTVKSAKEMIDFTIKFGFNKPAHELYGSNRPKITRLTINDG